MNKPFMRIIEGASREAEILIYEEIVNDLYVQCGYGGISAKKFDEQLRALGDVDKITVRINSIGGDVFDGLAIFNTLKNHPAKVTTQVDGAALSAASLIAMAGKKIVMGEGALMMIHRASSLEWGNANDMRKMAEELEKVDGQLAEIYARRGGKTAEAMLALMDAETWFTPDEAIEAGLADKAQKTEPAAGVATARLNERMVAKFRNAPAGAVERLRALAALGHADTDTDTDTAITGREAEQPGDERPADHSDPDRAARLRLLDLAIKNPKGRNRT